MLTVCTSTSGRPAMERNGSGSGGGGRSRLHHKRRPGHRRNTQHSVATVEPICDMRKVINGVVTVDQDKLNKLVQRDPIDLHYTVEEEPFARYILLTSKALASSSSRPVFCQSYIFGCCKLYVFLPIWDAFFLDSSASKCLQMNERLPLASLMVTWSEGKRAGQVVRHTVCVFFHLLSSSLFHHLLFHFLGLLPK